MELILADGAGVEKKYLDCEYDIEVGGNNNFEISIPYSEWDGDLSFGRRIYVPGTEYGGIISDIQGDTSKDTVFVRGLTWRGYWTKKFFKGPLNGELHHVLASLLGDYKGVFIVSDKSTGIYGSLTFGSYVTILEAAEGFLRSVNQKLSLKYVQTRTGGHVLVEATPISIYEDQVSQDGFLNFTTEDYRTGVNHVIGYDGTNTIHLYADKAGNIGNAKTFFGIDEITDVYEDITDEPDQAELIESATEHLEDLRNYQSINVTFNSDHDEDIQIGDVVRGVDYITGITVAKSVSSKIVTMHNDELTISYSVDDGESTSSPSGGGGSSGGGGYNIDIIYPVGSIYMSVNSTNPQSLFGGTWEQLKDRFLLAAGTTYAGGTTGGEATHTLTVNEMPSHSHKVSSGYESSYDNPDRLFYGRLAGGYNNDAYGYTQFIENTGGGQPHNNMPPYLAVYVWKRTA